LYHLLLRYLASVLSHVTHSTYLLLFVVYVSTAATTSPTLSLHDALPISPEWPSRTPSRGRLRGLPPRGRRTGHAGRRRCRRGRSDRKSTRLNSSHVSISYAVFCSKKKRCTYNIYFNTIMMTKTTKRKMRY